VRALAEVRGERIDDQSLISDGGDTRREALRAQADRQAIAQAVADLEAGRVLTLEQLDERVRRALK
jgi:hypothetical protein